MSVNSCWLDFTTKQFKLATAWIGAARLFCPVASFYGYLLAVTDRWLQLKIFTQQLFIRFQWSARMASPLGERAITTLWSAALEHCSSNSNDFMRWEKKRFVHLLTSCSPHWQENQRHFHLKESFLLFGGQWTSRAAFALQAYVIPRRFILKDFFEAVSFLEVLQMSSGPVRTGPHRLQL